MSAVPDKDLLDRLGDTPLLLPYQQRALNTVSAHQVTVIEKSRRIGLTWGLAALAVFTAAARKSAGGQSVYYLAYEKEMTREFIDVCAGWARMFDHAASAVEETIFNDGSKDILAFRISFASGFEIVALSSSPRGLRGRQGLVILDEAAFHDSMSEVLKAALALLMWGGKVVVVSTHDGVDNPFNQLIQEVRGGQRAYALERITLDDALADGLYRRICLVSGRDWSTEAEAAWRDGLVRQYGEGADEELFCVPSSAGGSWIAGAYIAAAAHPDAGRPDLYGGGMAYGGVDIARRSDRWVGTVIERVASVLWMRDEIVLRDTPFRDQLATVDAFMRDYRIIKLAADQTGMGEMPVEEMIRAHGSRVEGVLMSGDRRLSVASAAKDAFEQGLIRIPDDPALMADIRKIKRVAGPTGAPRLVAGRDASGHADRAWALFLAIAAAHDAPYVPYGFEPVTPPAWDPHMDDDLDDLRGGRGIGRRARTGILA
jgi:phage FluMu gp28-like protein